MDSNSSTKMKDSRTPTLRAIKTSGKHTEAEDSAAKQALDSHDKTLSEPGLSLETKIEQEKRRRFVLINECNRLTFAVKEKEARLKELQETLKTKTLQTTTYNNEETCKQRIRQLENNRDKMKTKITGAKEIQIAYQHIRDNLQQELCGMFNVLEQKERAVSIGQAEVDEASKQFQSAAAAADCTVGRMVQMEYETMENKREMYLELCQLSTEEKELKSQMETLGHLIQSRLKVQEIQEEEDGEEAAQSIPATDHQFSDICGASQSDMKLIEDMEALREALGCADVQELVNKVLSQQATKQQLFAEVNQCEELTRQEAEALTDQELQYAELKFSAKPAATRFDKVKEKMQAELNEEVRRVERLQAKLHRSQDLLDDVEQGVNNLYFRMSCVPVEGLPSASSTESIDQLRDISSRLPTLLQRASQNKAEISGLDQERVYSLLEELNRMESRNVKRPSTPIDTPHLSDDDEDESGPSREEIKRYSVRLVESQQNKRSSRTAKRKQ